jgi:hypothetical protein
MAGAALGTAGGPVGIAIGIAAGMIIEGAFSAAESLKNLSATVEATNSAFANSSPSQAIIQMQGQMRTFLRELKVGEATSGTSRGAMEARQRREDAAAPLQILTDNIQNTLSSWVDNAIASFNENVTAPLANAFNNSLFAQVGGNPVTAYEWVRDQGALAREKREQRKPGFTKLEFGRS